jgi:hypothetical protein
MKRLQNKKFDEIGMAVVKSGALPAREIDRIIADPALFDSVQRRIALESSVPASRKSYPRPFIAAFASVTLVAAVAFALVALRSTDDVVVQTPPVAAPQKAAEVSRFDKPDSIATENIRPIAEPSRPQRVSAPATVRPVRRDQPSVQQASYQADFYAVSYAGDPHETERGGRIVRVDIPRSTLFAMGVDIPLENERETVKADLLIGNDGVTRGIRVVEYSF